MTKDEAIELQSLMFEASEAIDDLAFLLDLDDIAKGACYGVIIKAGNALLAAAGAKEKTDAGAEQPAA